MEGGVADSVAKIRFVPGACAPWRRLSVMVFPCVGVCGYPVRTECGNACGSQDLQTHFLYDQELTIRASHLTVLYYFI